PASARPIRAAPARTSGSALALPTNRSSSSRDDQSNEAAASALFAFGRLGPRARGRLLQFALIEFNGGPDEILERALVDLVALEKIDRAPRIAVEARTEELVRIGELRSVHKGQLHLAFVGIGDRDYSVARPHWASHPFPFLDDVAVGSKNALADAGECLAAPIRNSCDQLVDTFRWIHWIFPTSRRPRPPP